MLAALRATVCGALLALVMPATAKADDYQLGQGYRLGDGLTLGAYISTEMSHGDRNREFIVDDLAILAYGNLTDNFSWLAELESVEPYVYDDISHTESWNLPPSVERLYGDYKFSDNLALRFGKQITPIGYWNLQPINVLRETTSDPRYSLETFPRFLTGLDVYGYTPFDEDTTYHVYLQGSQDLDGQYINIDIDHHYGVTLSHQLTSGLRFGGSLGHYREVDGQTTNYLQANARYEQDRLVVFGEGILDFHKPATGSRQTRAAYLQGEYHFSPKHALIARAEYFHDDAAGSGSTDRIGVLGYSYRPVFPVSLKIEYQWHSDSAANQVLGSISVLF